jgi:hypothetical protein
MLFLNHEEFFLRNIRVCKEVFAENPPTSPRRKSNLIISNYFFNVFDDVGNTYSILKQSQLRLIDYYF